MRVLTAVLLSVVCVGARAQAPDTPRAGDGRSLAVPGTGIELPFVYLDGGTFRMGTPENEAGRDDDEMLPTDVAVAPFWIGRYEVGWDAYAAFRFQARDTLAAAETRADAVARPSPPYEDPGFGMGNEGFPAVSMTQWAALQFARWVTDRTGEFVRLPTEAEWEYACRAEAVTPMARRDLERYAWYLENSGEVFHRTGTRDAGTYGIHDLLGNVAEWTLDQYVDDYAAALEETGTTDPWVEPTRLHPRTVKGGAYDDAADALRCGARLESSLNWKRRDPQIPKSFWWNTDSPFVGFRLVRPAHQPSPEEQAAFWALVLGE
jgi:formylglycine-generating enzyme required for sulfatase activity